MNIKLVLLAAVLITADSMLANEPYDPRPPRMRDKVLLVGGTVLPITLAACMLPPPLGGAAQRAVRNIIQNIRAQTRTKIGTVGVVGIAYEGAKCIKQAIFPTDREECEQAAWRERKAKRECEAARQEFLKAWDRKG